VKYPEEITEEQRSELHWAITDRYKALEKLEEDTAKKHAPTDGIRRLIKLYRASSQIVKGPDGADVEETIPGLLSFFAPDPELPLESQEGMEREVTDEPDLFGGGAETGGGTGVGGSAGKWNPPPKRKRGGGPELVGEVIGTIVHEAVPDVLTGGDMPPETMGQAVAADQAEADAAKKDPKTEPAIPDPNDAFAAAAASATPKPGATPLQPDYSTTMPSGGNGDI